MDAGGLNGVGGTKQRGRRGKLCLAFVLFFFGMAYGGLGGKRRVGTFFLGDF